MDANANSQVVPLTAKAKELRNFLNAETVVAELGKVLPKELPAGRIIRQTLTLANKNPGLLACTPVSILAGLIQAAELGLEMSGPLGQAYLVPRYNKHIKAKEATFQVGYRGLLALAWRSDRIDGLKARAVREHDTFKVTYGTYEGIEHEPPQRGDRGEDIGYYAICHYRPTGGDFEYMSRDEMVAFRQKYAAENPIWDSCFEDMALKTVLRKLCKRLPVAVQAQHAAMLDEYGEHGLLETRATGGRTEGLADRLVGPGEFPADDQGAEGEPEPEKQAATA